NPTTCTGTDGTITLSGLAANTNYTVAYNGNVGTAFVSDATGAIVISNLSSGNYNNITIEGFGNCTFTGGSEALIDPNAPTVDAGNKQVICFGTSVVLTATNPDGAIISWDNGITDGTTFTPAVGSIQYTTTAVLNGCSATDTVTVLVNPMPTFTTIHSDPT